jgi:hypothetical protein
VTSLGVRPPLLLACGAVLAVVAFQLWVTPSNPPGYHRDEAALSLNAYTLSTNLRDEDGARAPLFFRSYEDYKSPLYPYLLAGVFSVTGPEQQVARGFSAVLVLAAILLLGLLARRLTGSSLVAVATVVVAGLTPWLFELGRVAYEASTQPLLLVLLLLGLLARRLTGSSLVAVATVVVAGLTPWLFELGRVAYEASTQPLLLVLLLLWLERTVRAGRYSVMDGVVAGVLLGLVTYSYTGSRLLGPLLAGALVVFAGRGRWRFVLGAWAIFAAALVPMGIYALRHPGALTARYEATSIARDESGARMVVQAVANWFHDVNPWHWATAGDPAPYIHNSGYGAFYAGVATLAIAGAVLVLLRRRADLWWRYVLLATLLVPIPASLTVDRFNAIRLAALPVFALVLAIPALDALLGAARRSRAAQAAVAVLALSIGVQLVDFLDGYRTRGPARVVLFDTGVRSLLEPPLEAGETIHIDFDDRGAQTLARWYTAESGRPQSQVVVLADGGIPPPGSVVFARFQDCDYVCETFAEWEQYRLARAVRP